MRWFIAVSLLVFMITNCVNANKNHVDEIKFIFWNLESGDSSAAFIAEQMVEKKDIDFWGLSEVLDQESLDIYVAALGQANPHAKYRAKLSESGGEDRLAIIYRADKLIAVPYSGSENVTRLDDNFFEVESINVGGSIRPALGMQLSVDGQDIVVLTNHWKCCSGEKNIQRRQEQAQKINEFAQHTSNIPIIAGGDFNIPIGKNIEPAFRALITTWLFFPAQANVGSFRTGSVLDSVFVTGKNPRWKMYTSIREREGDEAAKNLTFDDTNHATDHRPIMLMLGL